MNRREFLKTSSVAAAAAPLAIRQSRQPGSSGANRSPANRVRIGIVGCGVQGLLLVSRLASLAGVEVAAAADLYDGHLARAAEIVGPQLVCTRDWRRVVERSDVDAVIVATPDHWHVPVALAAVQSGKDVYCESPVAHRPREAAPLLDAARAGNRVLQGGGGWISRPVFAAARDVMASGTLGRLTLVRATWDSSTALDAWRVPFPPDASPQTIDYASFAASGDTFDPARFFRWRCYRAYGSGLAGARFAPALTAIHWLANLSSPSRVSAMGALVRWKDGREVPDTLHASIEYPEECVVMLSATQAGGRARELRFVGTDATLAIDRDGYWIEENSAAEPYGQVAESWPKGYKEWFYMMHGMTPEGQLRGTPPPEPSRQRFDVPAAASSRTAHLSDFVDAVRTRRAPKEPGDLAANAAEAAMLIDTAANAPARSKA